ncbi:MAG: hypothetical protein JSS98_18805 [Bacteroidetes bacterium]|nr:hypothetical protein [Bacteroidota bacterium]
MKKQFSTLIAIFILSSPFLYAQKNDSLFSRLQAISNSGLDFFNVDGIEITSQIINSEFSKKGILKKFKKFSIKENDLILTDSSIHSQNYYLSKSEEIQPGTVQYSSYYFIENKYKQITAITFAGFNKNDKVFENKFVGLILNDEIPKSIYTPLEIDSINFAGRKIGLGKSCHWMGINNVQCPYYGQMNWSVHKTLEDASKSADSQYTVIKLKRGGKIISEDTVNVIFEGVPVKAKKAVYDFKGVTSLLVSMAGGKTLTIYFVAAPAKQNFVSCVMSFWNNDNINPSGLPPLLEEVMKLTK